MLCYYSLNLLYFVFLITKVMCLVRKRKLQYFLFICYMHIYASFSMHTRTRKNIFFVLQYFIYDKKTLLITTKTNFFLSISRLFQLRKKYKRRNTQRASLKVSVRNERLVRVFHRVSI
jgi:hypothetical protein